MLAIIVTALLVGVAAGLRAMTAPAVVSWAAVIGWLPLGGTKLSFLDSWITACVFSVLALAEFVTDQLPRTPSRTVPVQFGTRLVSGGFCGAAIGLPSGAWLAGLVAGVVGAAVGTLGGAAVRARLAAAFGQDRPAALLEDAVAIALVVFVAWAA